MAKPHAFLLVPLLAGLTFAPAGSQDPGDAVLSGGPPQLAIRAAQHVRFQRQWHQRLEREPALVKKPIRVYDSGRVAVIEGDGRLVVAPAPFDLANRGIQFVPREGGYQGGRSAQPLLATIGERIDLDDEGSMAVDLPGWEFPFFGETYSRVYVNANGNLTFGAPAASWRCDLSRLVTGPPRIAPLLVDLDPGRTNGEDGVYVMVFPTRLRVTWLRVPEWGTTNQSSFQVTLHRDGRIRMLYGDVDAEVGIVGLAPGGGDPRLELLDFTVDLPHPPVAGAVAEAFSFQHEYDELGVSRTFYEHFADVYDIIVIYLDFPHALLGGAANAYYSPFKNTVRGIGRGIFDDSELAGSDGRLQGIAHMGMTDVYPDDPDEVFRHIHTPLSILTHEVCHRWLASVSFLDQDGNVSADLRAARIRSHWSFYFHSDASVMLGNDIRDNGDGTFLTIGGPRRFGDLDLYLMGLIPPEEVRELFYVDNVLNPTPDRKPEGGVTIIGDRVNVTIDQIIAVEGPRIPSSAESQKHFRVAFVLLTADGKPPRPESLARLRRIRRRWMEYIPEISRGLATVATRLDPK